MNLITLAVPFFFLFIGIEVLFARRYYRLSDSIGDLGCGVLQQMLGLFTAGLIAAAYAYLFQHHALFTVSPRSPLMWALLFLGVDLCYYWFHRLSHEINVLWAIHVVHHQSEEYNLTVALRQAALQPLVSWVFYLPLAVLGFPPAMFATMSALNTIYQFWIHTRALPKLGPLEWVLNTPSHHRVHHGSNEKYLDRNHGGTLIIWDRLFGTFQEEEEEPRYGVTRPLYSYNPVWANLHAFVDLHREARKHPRLRDRILTWLMPPGWSPAGPKPPGPPAPPHEERAPRRTRIYAVAHFVPTVLLASALLVFYRRLPGWQTQLAVGGVTLTMLCLGGLLDGRRWAPALERARVGLLAVAALWGLVKLGASG